MAFSDHLQTKDWTFSATSQAAQRRKEIALYLLIASLGMFFTAALLGYLLIRLRMGQEAPPLHLPPIFWLSSLFAIVGSAFLWQALRSVRRERQERFRRQLLTAFVLGLCFCLSQAVGLTSVLRDHFAAQRERPPATKVETPPPVVRPKITVPSLQPNPTISGDLFKTQPTVARAVPAARLEGLLFVLVLLHVLHFVAGMIGLTIVTFRGLAGRYDHEYHGGVRLCAVYWRFLDVVWIILFGAFLLTS